MGVSSGAASVGTGVDVVVVVVVVVVAGGATGAFCDPDWSVVVVVVLVCASSGPTRETAITSMSCLRLLDIMRGDDGLLITPPAVAGDGFLRKKGKGLLECVDGVIPQSRVSGDTSDRAFRWK